VGCQGRVLEPEGGGMIFCAKNEDGVPTWKLVLEGKKTVTRRLKPMPVGKEFAIQPGRGKKAVARGKVISCIKHIDWVKSIFPKASTTLQLRNFQFIEVHKEGFKVWQGLINWFEEHKININDTYRIEFELIPEDNNG